mmetsp:Transcript_35257/g.48166  ORF Transcript_35257/g.48166 Transcript_35257/m.48166 type:complete len:431 (+) Transcript_35257:79-1371(+)
MLTNSTIDVKKQRRAGLALADVSAFQSFEEPTPTTTSSSSSTTTEIEPGKKPKFVNKINKAKEGGINQITKAKEGGKNQITKAREGGKTAVKSTLTHLKQKKKMPTSHDNLHSAPDPNDYSFFSSHSPPTPAANSSSTSILPPFQQYPSQRHTTTDYSNDGSQQLFLSPSSQQPGVKFFDPNESRQQYRDYGQRPTLQTQSQIDKFDRGMVAKKQLTRQRIVNSSTPSSSSSQKHLRRGLKNSATLAPPSSLKPLTAVEYLSQELVSKDTLKLEPEIKEIQQICCLESETIHQNTEKRLKETRRIMKEISFQIEATIHESLSLSLSGLEKHQENLQKPAASLSFKLNDLALRQSVLSEKVELIEECMLELQEERRKKVTVLGVAYLFYEFVFGFFIGIVFWIYNLIIGAAGESEEDGDITTKNQKKIKKN